MQTAPKTFSITRTLNAPRTLVWDVWTKPEHLMQWFTPKGFVMPTCNMDFRVGGTFHYSQKTPDGMEMWGMWIFRDITAPERLELINHFSDKDRGVTRHPLAPTWPTRMLSVTTLVEHGGKTDLTIEWTPYEASEEEIVTFNGAFDSMNGGWAGTFEQLEAYLASIQ